MSRIGRQLVSLRKLSLSLRKRSHKNLVGLAAVEPLSPPPLPCCSFSPVGVSFSLVAISYRAQLGRLGGSRSGLGSSNKNPVPHTQYQGTLLAPNRCSMHPIAVLIPVSHREFRSNLPSLAYLSVYPFGPRFLLFTVRNTSVIRLYGAVPTPISQCEFRSLAHLMFTPLDLVFCFLPFVFIHTRLYRLLAPLLLLL